MNTFVNWRIKMRRTLKKDDLINFVTSDTYREMQPYNKNKKGNKIKCKTIILSKKLDN